MDGVEFYFSDSTTNSEIVRRYEVSAFDDAIGQFHKEFPDENTRPRISRVRVEHIQPNVV